MYPNRGLVSLLSMHFRRAAHIPQSLRQWRSAASPGASKTETSQGQVRQSELTGANAGPGTQAPRRPHSHQKVRGEPSIGTRVPSPLTFLTYTKFLLN